ncbi:MAG TPA: beta-xylosidase [Spirochaetia bacterium]|nr:beta-xylosidase [Spirochaetia bacterium]
MKATILAGNTVGELKKYWTKCVGSCHAATALRQDWRAQLKKCREELGFEYVRFHGLLNDDMSVCVRGESGSFEYSFFNVDSIFDFLLSIGMKPFIELSFMPTALSSGTKTVFHYQGNITPPRSYDQWADLVGALADHLVRRYGPVEVRKWFFEVWNEPNLDIFWAGSMENYFLLYKYAAIAIKEVDSRLAVGGPATAIDAWIPEFREFCKRQGVPLDFVSTHHYPTDASYGFGLDMEEQMARSSRGVLYNRTRKALAEAGSLPLYYTEWNNSPSPRDPYHDTSYNAAFITKTIVDNLGLLDCYSFWTFTDIFEESGFSSVPFHGGFGLLNIHGIPKPSYRAFQLLSRLSGDRLEIAVHEESPTVECAATIDGRKLTILISNHQIPLSPIESELVSIRIKGVAAVGSAVVERIDETHVNPKAAWVDMGSPNYPDKAQIETLIGSSELASEPVELLSRDGEVSMDLLVQPHSVAAISLTLEG